MADETSARNQGMWDMANNRPLQSVNEAMGIVVGPHPDGPQSVNGWTPPLFYDLGSDETRIATQADFDRLAATERAYADVVALARQIIERHENLLLNERRRSEHGG